MDFSYGEDMKQRTLFILGILMILLIWTNSLLPANLSGSQSGFVTNIIHQVISFLNIEVETDLLHLIIRKIAHFTEFFILGVIWISYFNKTSLNQKLLKTMTLGFSVAVTDEVIQIFVPGRVFAVTDILIDLLGVTLGILLMTIISKIKK